MRSTYSSAITNYRSMKRAMSDSAEWACSACTFANSGFLSECEICGTLNPNAVPQSPPRAAGFERVTRPRKQEAQADAKDNVPKYKLRGFNQQRLPFSFPSPFSQLYGGGSLHAPRLKVDKQVGDVKSAIATKPSFTTKMNDLVILTKWIEEAKAQNLPVNVVQRAVAELQWEVALAESPAIRPSEVMYVWQSDEAVSAALIEKLKECLRPFESVPEDQKDWHPGSNKQVLDLIHPSLYCYVNKETNILTEDQPLRVGSTEATLIVCAGEPKDTFKLDYDMGLPYDEFAMPDDDDDDINEEVLEQFFSSTKYQWLPSDFAIGKDGKVQIISYINNLHPKHDVFYRTLERIFESFVPMFNVMLTRVLHSIELRVDPDLYKWDYDGDDDQEPEERALQELDEFKPPEVHKVDLRGRTVQVIVKAASIHLTPDNPRYPGGSWHLEGMRQENIIGTGIIYYDMQNTSESELGFRRAFYEPDHSGEQDALSHWGISNGTEYSEDLGSITAQNGRCVVFPNILQHCVAPFELLDKTRPGYRKILVFFLVDPNEYSLSTALVPPQQKEWIIPILVKMLVGMAKLPDVLCNLIVEYSSPGMDFQTACEHREKLMEERKFYVDVQNKQKFERACTLCEH